MLRNAFVDAFELGRKAVAIQKVTSRLDAKGLNVECRPVGVRFDPTNSVDSTSKVRFLLAATQGQTLSVKVTAAANEVSMGVFAANNAVMKAQDTTLTFTGTIPVTGDTAIDIASVTGTTSKSFTLEVTVTRASS